VHVRGVLAIMVVTHVVLSAHILHHLLFKDEDSGGFN